MMIPSIAAIWTVCTVILLPGTSAIFPFGPAFIFQTSSRPPAQNNTAGSFTSNISFDAISNVSNVVVAVSQTMGRSLDTADLSDDGSVRQHINSSVFLFKDGNWTSYKLRKRRSTFDLAKQITNQVFAAVNSFMNQTANQTTFDLLEQLLNASSAAMNNRSSRQTSISPMDPIGSVDLFDEASQDLLNDLDTLGSYSKQQRAMIAATSRNLMEVRSSSWRVLFDDFKDFTFASQNSMSVLQSIFNNAVDRFSRALENNDKCWPTEANLNPLSRLFRSAADTMAQCFGKVFADSRTLLDGLRGNFSAPLSVPMELFQQFNYCESLNSDNAFSALSNSVCWAKIPILLETYALNTRLAYRRLTGQGQEMMLLLKGNMMQCTLDELTVLQDTSEGWYSTYGQCMAITAEPEPTTESA